MKATDFTDKLAAVSEEHESMATEFKQELMGEYIDAGIVEVYSPKEFLRLSLDYYSPFQLSCIIHQSNLSLDYEYLYVPDNGMYNEYKEADRYADLYDLIGGDMYIAELSGTTLDSIYNSVTSALIL